MHTTKTATPSNRARGSKLSAILIIAATWIAGSFTIIGCADIFADGVAVTYKVEITMNWTADQSPGVNFPNGAHFTDFVIASHVPTYTIWREDGTASKNVEVVAETGQTGGLVDELNSLQRLSLGDVVVADGTSAVGTTSKNIRVSPTYRFVSAISMVAPSPDWFTGISNLNLYPAESWLNSVTMNLVVYDAGTEGGTEFRLDNPAETTIIRQFPIDSREAFNTAENAVVGTIKFTRQ